MKSKDIRKLRLFTNLTDLQTHSGIYPANAVTERPVLNSRGEYTDPEIQDQYLEAYARIAAFGPLRTDETEIARALFADQPGQRYDNDLGWYLQIQTGYVKNEPLRLASSSGGIATALLGKLLESGQIDAVIHIRRSDSYPLFQYGVSRTTEQIRQGSKTRYYPGSLFDSLEEVRAHDGRYAIVGIPSFISELRRLEEQEPALKERITVHIGLICGHQKTANYLSCLAWSSGIDPSTIIDVDFRTKLYSRRANEYLTKVTYRKIDGTIGEELIANPRQQITNWGLGMFKSTFSDFSDDAFNETADIVLGDAWLPEFTSDYRGTNLVIVRSQRMADALECLQKAGDIELAPCSERDALRSQKSLVRHSRREISYRRQWMKRKHLPVPTNARLLGDDQHILPIRRAIQRQRTKIARQSHEIFQQALRRGSVRYFTLRMAPMVFRYRILNKLSHLQESRTKPVWPLLHRPSKR